MRPKSSQEHTVDFHQLLARRLGGGFGVVVIVDIISRIDAMLRLFFRSLGLLTAAEKKVSRNTWAQR